MNLLARTIGLAALIAAVIPAQTPIPSYKSQEDYCYHNPDAVGCRDGKVVNVMEEMQKNATTMMGPWCQQNPNDKACGGTRPATTNLRPARAVRPPAAQPAYDPTAGLPLPAPPSARRTRGPSNIQLGQMDWRLVLPMPDVVIGMNVSGLVDSELARALIKEWSGKLGITPEEQDKMLASMSDVSQAIISVRQQQVLVALVGRLQDFPEQARFGQLQCARVSADTVIFGTHNTLYWTMTRLKLPLMETPAMREVRQLSDTYQIWAWGKPVALGAMGAQPMSANSPVKKIDFGVSLRDQFRMDLKLDAGDAATAAKILETSTKGAPRDLQSAVEGNTVHYTLILDRDAMLKRFAGAASNSIGKQFAPLLNAARQVSTLKAHTATPHPAPGKIVIDGLDDGPREISATPRQ